MSDLIERLERADGPSRRLFAEVFKAIFPPVLSKDSTVEECERADLRAYRFFRMLDAEAWESAALMLVPGGWTGFVAVDADNETWLWPCNSIMTRGFRIAHKISAIALCIATLKAKDADNG